MMRPDIKDSLDLYAKHGCPTGGFLAAVLSNDLKDACARADSDNRHAIFDIVSYIYNNLPSGCWGSRERVRAWIDHGGFAGLTPAKEDQP